MIEKTKIIEKIQNVFDLANNNTSETEAIAAALKAQQLMVKYDIEMTEVKDQDRTEEIIKDVIRFDSTNQGYCTKWKFDLAETLAKNFKVKWHLQNRKHIVFYGFESDVRLVVSVFNFLFATGNKLSCRYYYQRQKEGLSTKGIMNTYLQGFVAGLKDELEKQTTALMVVVPQEVEDAYAEYSADFRHTSYSISYASDSRAYGDGRKEGRYAVQSRALESASA